MVAVTVTGVLLTIKYESAPNYGVKVYYQMTQLLPISTNSKLVQSLELSKPNINICANKFIVLPCKNLKKSTEMSNTSINSENNGVYLLEDSVIHFTAQLESNQIANIIITRDTGEITCRRTDEADLLDFSQAEGLCTAKQEKKPGQFCFNITAENPNITLPINISGLYISLNCFLYPSPESGENRCGKKLNYTTDIVHYNFTMLSENVTVREISTSKQLVKLHSDNENPFEIESKCIITKVMDHPDYLCGTERNCLSVNVTDIKITKKLWFIPGVSVGLVLLLVIIVLAVVTVISCKKSVAS